ncbi:alpha/beta hydrolase [Paenibacillus naphthalenovorans]|uniref:Esterase n=1 Tax=Paenibacillus naphthalenovorans TaxID=162209 RepID=A0A0U2WCF6_9BACL|nr:alpha/beta fold hydrolase [Paenibacillus naphthalenovorans]ALS25117.1 esterase [Paenibacillus naphthalenovorans]GCL73225.1 esterase [Paenibacillus naphthalenovorans]SDI35349.1 phospholipase/carboxylesterase [Paenibacillus naphthalenovorans]
MAAPFEYTVIPPKAIESGKTYPAVFALHGIGYTEKDMLSVIEPLKGELFLIGIRGHLPYEAGHAYYYLKSFGNPERDLFDRSVEMLQHFIDDAVRRFPIDPRQVYLIGFSQGAILSLTLALTLGSKVKGVIAMNGYIPSFVKEEYVILPAGHLSVFLSDGDCDPIFPPSVGAESHQYLKDKVERIQYVTYSAAHEITDRNKADVVAWIEKEIAR